MTPAQQRAERRRQNRENYVYMDAPDKNIQRFATISVAMLFGFVLLIPIIALLIDIRENRIQQSFEAQQRQIEKDKAEKAAAGLTSFFDTDKIVFYLPRLPGNYFQLSKKFRKQFLLPLNEALLADTTKFIQVECFTLETDKKAVYACTDIHQNLTKQNISPNRIKTFISNDSTNFKLKEEFYYIVVTIDNSKSND